MGVGVRFVGVGGWMGVGLGVRFVGGVDDFNTTPCHATNINPNLGQALGRGAEQVKRPRHVEVRRRLPLLPARVLDGAVLGAWAIHGAAHHHGCCGGGGGRACAGGVGCEKRGRRVVGCVAGIWVSVKEEQEEEDEWIGYSVFGFLGFVHTAEEGMRGARRWRRGRGSSGGSGRCCCSCRCCCRGVFPLLSFLLLLLLEPCRIMVPRRKVS